MGFLYFMRSNAPRRAGVLLGLFGLAKVELLLASALCLLMWMAMLRDKMTRFNAVAAYVACLGILCFPAVFLYGTGGIFGGRAFETLSQHFAALYCASIPNACFGVGNGWNNPNPIMQLLFPDAHSITDILFLHPREYLRILALGFRESFGNIIIALNGTIFLIVIALFRPASMEPCERRFCAIVLLAAAASLLPALLIAFVHVRYVARFSPAVLIIALIMLGFSRKQAVYDRQLLIVTASVLAITSIAQAVLLFPRIATTPHGF